MKQVKLLAQSVGSIALVFTIILSAILSTNVFKISGFGTYDGPIFDVHVNAEAMNEALLRTFMSNLQQVGITKAVLNGWDESVDPSFKIMRFKQLYPDRIIPSLYFGPQPYQANSTRALLSAENAYDKGFRMFGEMLLKHLDDAAIPADDPNVLKIFDIAAKRHMPVLVHHDRDYAEIERALEHNRNATIIFHGWRCSWTQCDFSPSGFRKLLLKHLNLVIALDTLRFPWVGAVFVDPSTGILRNDWKKLFEGMPYRFVVGSDFYDPEKDFTLESVKSFANLYRGMLGQLSPEVARRIAYQNLEDLLARETSLTSTSSAAVTTHAVETVEIAKTITIATSSIAVSNWLQTNWEYIVIVPIIFAIVMILVARVPRKRR